MVQPLRHLVAGHEAAAEHLVAAGVAGVLGVVDDQHGGRCEADKRAILRGWPFRVERA
jgi:hypothetical protein